MRASAVVGWNGEFGVSLGGGVQIWGCFGFGWSGGDERGDGDGEKGGERDDEGGMGKWSILVLLGAVFPFWPRSWLGFALLCSLCFELQLAACLFEHF